MPLLCDQWKANCYTVKLGKNCGHELKKLLPVVKKKKIPTNDNYRNVGDIGGVCKNIS